jgi:acetyltransferase-like isoleucine patch superfamily enzyme
MTIINGILRYYSGFCFFMILFVSHIPSHTIRNFIYRRSGLKMGDNSVIYGKAEIRSPKNITIGHNSIIGHNAILDGRGGLVIGNNVNFSSGVWIWTAEHDLNDPDFVIRYGPVIIEDYAWISCRTTILPNIKIGRGAVVCAGAVVTKDIPPFAIAAGVPAKIIGERNKDLHYELTNGIPFV